MILHSRIALGIHDVGGVEARPLQYHASRGSPSLTIIAVNYVVTLKAARYTFATALPLTLNSVTPPLNGLKAARYTVATALPPSLGVCVHADPNPSVPTGWFSKNCVLAALDAVAFPCTVQVNSEGRADGRCWNLLTSAVSALRYDWRSTRPGISERCQQLSTRPVISERCQQLSTRPGISERCQQLSTRPGITLRSTPFE
jgi:hypothetical protein